MIRSITTHYKLIRTEIDVRIRPNNGHFPKLDENFKHIYPRNSNSNRKKKTWRKPQAHHMKSLKSGKKDLIIVKKQPQQKIVLLQRSKNKNGAKSVQKLCNPEEIELRL